MEMKSNPRSGSKTAVLHNFGQGAKQKTSFGVGRDSSTFLLQRGAQRMNRRTCLSVSRAVSTTFNTPEG